MYEQHIGQSHQRTTHTHNWIALRREGDRGGVTHCYLATSHKFATLVTSAQHSTNNQREAEHGASSPLSCDSTNDHWALIRGLTALLNRGGLSVLAAHNIRVTHLANATNSSVSSRIPNRSDCVYGVPKPPSNGSKPLPLGAGET